MKKRILVVEDEVIIADDLCNTLTKLGYETLEPALTYREAITRFDDEPVDMVILDINLGGKKTGIDVANYIRNSSNTPFIYLTSFSDSRTLELAKVTMPYAYLVKPFEPADVLTTLEIAFNNHARYINNNADEDEAQATDFTSMEMAVLRNISDNMTTKKIAELMHVSESTIKNHRHNICVKLELPATTHSLLNWVLRNKKTINS